MNSPAPERRLRGRPRAWMHALGDLLEEASGASHGQRRYWALKLEIEAGGRASAIMNLRDDSMPELRLEIEMQGGAKGEVPVKARILRTDPDGNSFRTPLERGGRTPPEMLKAEEEVRRVCRKRAFLALRRQLEPSLWGWSSPDASLRRGIRKRWPERPVPPGPLMPGCSLGWAWQPGRRTRVPSLLDMAQMSQTLANWWIQMMIGTNRDNDGLPRSAKARNPLWTCPWDRVAVCARRDPWKGRVECHHQITPAAIDGEGALTPLPPPHPDLDGLRVGRALDGCALDISELRRRGLPLSGIWSWLHDGSQADAEAWRPPPWGPGDGRPEPGASPVQLLEGMAAHEMMPELWVSLKVPRSFLYRVWTPRRTRGGAPLPPGARAALAEPDRPGRQGGRARPQARRAG